MFWCMIVTSTVVWSRGVALVLGASFDFMHAISEKHNARIDVVLLTFEDFVT